eukprot:TRINITY_DN13331_c0_g1_i1.p1 TRINITY_DN13331_c0_g1~~TRINITY_DN13331_c0_g1_i1.p1  ORF type:complete len:155 (-),score=32.31 TRINITY_DN13331_c0_g1_i1:110-511(-)
MQRLVVGGFIFLRFFCPSIVTPEKYGLASSAPSIQVRRTLVMITKLLQNLANGVEFDGSKEAYMKGMNSFITSNIAEVNRFFDDLTNQESIAKKDPISVVEPGNPEEALTDICNYIAFKQSIICQLLDNAAKK